MIRGFADKTTKAIYEGRNPKGVPAGLLESARDKLALLEMATGISDLRFPPSNRLESIHSLPGLYSMRVNRQFRIVFRWVDGAAEDVKFVDYH
jgi:proteic killer suppression protein